MNLEKIQLGHEAHRYFLEQLNYESKLSGSLKSKCRFDDGLFYTFLPSSTSEDRIRNFASGGILNNCDASFETQVKDKSYVVSEIYSLNDYLLEYLYEKMKNSRKLCVFHDVMASPSDAFLDSQENKFFINNNEIYQYILSDQLKLKDKLGDAIVSTKVNWYFLCCIFSMSTDCSKKDLTLEDLDFTMLEDVIISAYDGEGFLVWEKGNNKEI